MMLMLQTRARSRIALAGLLAVISGTSFAQADTSKPGTVASAQAKSKASAPAKAAPKAPANSAPATPPASAAPEAQMQADGRLKPRIINPASSNQDGSGMSGAIPGIYTTPITQAIPGSSSPRQPQQQQGNHGMGAPPVSAGAPRNPFAPAEPAAPTSPPTVHQTSPFMGGAPKTFSANIKKGEPTGPSINLACTTPEIKTQGVFVGKIQNRYVYKYKNQYCFGIEP